MNIVVDTLGKVLMWSESSKPTPPSGARLVELNAEQARAFLSTANTRGVVFDGKTFAALPALPAPPDQTVEQKLARIGISVADLRAVLQ
jgi:hypothetical protein